MERRRFLQGLGAGFALSGAPAGAVAEPDAPLRVFLAASLLSAFEAVIESWGSGAPERPRLLLSYGSSAALARRIELGAPADVFISANSLWMDHLQSEEAVDAETRRDLLSNRLALAAAPGAAPALASRDEIDAAIDLRSALGARGRLAIARVSSVPLGMYARQALTRLGLWASVADRLAEAADARAALAYVARGATPLGVLYASDLTAAEQTLKERAPRRIGLFPAGSHDPIRYPAAVVRRATAPRSARDLLTYLASEEAMSVFRSYGFAAPAA